MSEEPGSDDSWDIELKLFIEAILLKYGYDFRDYARASLKRRLLAAVAKLGCSSLSQLQERVLHDPATFPVLLDFLTVQVSEMFRDPGYFKALREQVLPILRTYPSLKIWVAGCSAGEEAYSLAILLHEERLLERSLIYATDINTRSLRAAQTGVYEVSRIAAFTENHRKSGSQHSLSEYYTAAYGAARFDSALRERIVFSDHSLATDAVFAEVHLVSCRNVLIYFNRQLQDRALALFHEALTLRGFLGIGSKESVRFSAHARHFEEVVPSERIYRRVGT